MGRMITIKAALLFLVCSAYHAPTAIAFVPVSVVGRSKHGMVLFSEDPTADSSEGGESSVPTPPAPPSPPPVPKRRMDPLMASLTRMDPEQVNAPTKNVPFLGEIPADGSLTVLLPAAGIAVLGFIFSIIVAVNAQDQLVGAFSNVGQDIAQKVAEQPNQKYDDSTCRGICSSQEKDLDGLRKVMESLRKE